MTAADRKTHVAHRFALAAVAGCAAVALSAGSAFAAHTDRGPSTLHGRTLVAAAPTGSTGPDDITRMAIPGFDSGQKLIWTAYQNGINPDGTPGTPGGPTSSTVAGYDPRSGKLFKTIPVLGKVDGLKADPQLDRLVATVNEDNNSALDLVNVATGDVTTYHYAPSPAVNGVGGTDSVAVVDGRIYVVHSNPANTSQAAEYAVTLVNSTHTARLDPVFRDNSSAWNVLMHKRVTLALTDPDTNYLMPGTAPRFGGQLATISQGDGEIVFASDVSDHPRLSVLSLTDNVSGNVPPIDGIAVATSGEGTLFVVDAKGNTISALRTTGWAAGTVFVSEPNDNNNPLIGTLNLNTGKITPLGNTFVSPKGLLFVPDGDDGVSE